MNHLKYKDVGGATSFEYLWGYHLLKYNISSTKLKRQTGDFIDHSLRQYTLSPEIQIIKHSDLLPVNHLTTCISFPSSSNPNDIGHKQLTASELAKIFGLPTKFSSHQLAFTSFPFFSLQVFDTILQPLYGVHITTEFLQPLYEVYISTESLFYTTSSSQPVSASDNYPFLPVLQKAMPHTW